MIDSGVTGKTIEMDERFIDKEGLVMMENYIDNPINAQQEELEDIGHGRSQANAYLGVPAKPKEDLIGQPSDVNYLPGSAGAARSRDNTKSQT